MSKTIELSDPVYDVLTQVCRDNGLTPEGWIADHLPKEKLRERIKNAKNMAELFAGRLGSIASGGKERLSENCREKVTDILEQKRREGRL